MRGTDERSDSLLPMKSSTDSTKQKRKILLSFGLGRLHFVQATESLLKHGLDMEVAQGLVPKRSTMVLFQMISSANPKLRRVYFGLRRRMLEILPADLNHSIGTPEVLQEILIQVSKLGIGSTETARRFSWRSFGRLSAKLLSNQDIVHVRAGAGHKIIEAARARRIPVLVDFSIAHPAFIEATLRPEYAERGKPFSIDPRHGFWGMCLDDADRADMILVNSDFVKETFIREGFPAEKLFVSYLGVRSDFLGIKKSYLLGSPIRLLFTGAFGYRKGAQYLIPALERLQEVGVEFTLTILGSTDEAAALLKNSQLGERIHAPGFVPQDELRRYLSQADLYVFPSLAEGCASSAMEAMAAGLPVIATRQSGLPITHGQTGIIIREKSSDEIFDAIIMLSQDATLRSEIGRAAASQISNGYSWDAYAMRVSGIYERLLSKGHRVSKEDTA